MAKENTLINYVEFKAGDLEATKTFYSGAFGWTFTDYGPSYIAFSHSGLEGGFEKSQEKVVRGALVVLYHRDLLKIRERVIAHGGQILRDIFAFPGGKRFHFSDPSGNELAIWSEN